MAATTLAALGLSAAGALGPIPAVAAPAERVADIHSGPATGSSHNWIWEADFEPFDGRVFFTVDDGIHGNELWATDGTEAGTGLVADLCPGVCSSNPYELTAGGDRLYFRVEDALGDRELWVSDGTAAGTRQVVDLIPGRNGSGPAGLTVLGDRVVFAATSLDRPRTLWSSDGTAAGTVPIGGTDPATTPANPIPLATIGGLLVFGASDPARGFEPWVTDGTAAGTLPLGDLEPGAGGSLGDLVPRRGIADFAALDDLLLFVADDGTTGREPWVTDGTPAGTVRLADVYPGSDGSGPTSFEACGGRVYFRADDPVHGRELSPLSFTRAGDWLYFAATDAVSGFELWRLPLADGTGAAKAEVNLE